MLNAIPIVGWLLDFVFCASLSLPFWFCWTCCGLGQLYFGFLPERYQSIPFWHCVGLFIIIGILRPMLTPKIVEVTQE